MMKTLNRWNGVMKGATGLGLMCAAGCGLAAGWGWLMLPALVWGGMRLGTGAAMAVTGMSDE